MIINNGLFFSPLRVRVPTRVIKGGSDAKALMQETKETECVQGLLS